MGVPLVPRVPHQLRSSAPGFLVFPGSPVEFLANPSRMPPDFVRGKTTMKYVVYGIFEVAEGLTFILLVRKGRYIVTY